jgi:CheY-like chemotaxis protein
VKELVELHGGTIRADSEGRGRGATFSVSLPLVDSGATRGERIGPSGDVDLGGTCVLIVEDEGDTRAAIAQMLVGSHAEIETAASADEALEQLAAVRPRVLISDIGMPGKDGYELIREIRASREYEHLPAIALTAFSRDEDKLRALEAGYDKHLSKPVDSRELLKAVASLARRPH